jgi:hypothetical protein
MEVFEQIHNKGTYKMNAPLLKLCSRGVMARLGGVVFAAPASHLSLLLCTFTAPILSHTPSSRPSLTSPRHCLTIGINCPRPRKNETLPHTVKTSMRPGPWTPSSSSRPDLHSSLTLEPATFTIAARRRPR